MADKLAPVFLDALHPTGAAGVVRLIGDALPIGLASADNGLAPDTIVVGPTSVQIEQASWLESAGQMIRSAKPDTLVVALLPKGGDGWLRRMLPAAASARMDAFGVTHTGNTPILVPLLPGPIRAMRQTWPVSRRWHLVEILQRLFDPQVSRWLVPARLCIVVRPPGSVNWLDHALQQERVCPLVGGNWRGPDHGAILLALLPDSANPIAVAKLPAKRARPEARDERNALQTIAPGAAAARLRVPSALPSTVPKGRWWLQSALSGRPLAAGLRSGSLDCSVALESLADAMSQWCVQSGSATPLTEADIHRWFLAPLEELAGDLDDGSYRARIEAALATLKGTPVWFAPAHGDVTCANLLWDRMEGLGLVDWETAREIAPAMIDLPYAICDIVMTHARDNDRLSAFRSAFTTNRDIHAVLCRARDRVHVTTMPESVQSAWLILAFHACWLHHARNERAAGHSQQDRPFLAIVRRLASRDGVFDPFESG